VNKYYKQVKYRQNQRDKKECYRLNSTDTIRESYYQPPEFRGLRIYGDCDLGYLRLIYISLWECGRLDSYYIRNEKVENIGKRPKLNDDNSDWWIDSNGNRKKYGKVNLDKKIRELMPNIRRAD
jgi:hypothetical protein